MKIRGQLFDILHEIFPGVYNKCVRNEVKKNIIYVWMLKSLYIMLVSPIMY